ncbi:hypothetical protein FRC0135_00130 [Corynebacterium diphtheriae]|nr:hypothetical protein FRC0135_00130 [Corynebacterium diphtheriae]
MSRVNSAGLIDSYIFFNSAIWDTDRVIESGNRWYGVVGASRIRLRLPLAFSAYPTGFCVGVK